MKNLTINNETFKITKKEIREAYESEKQFIYGMNYYCSDFNDVLILASRIIEPRPSKKETIDFIYENIETIINDSINDLNIVAEYFNQLCQFLLILTDSARCRNVPGFGGKEY